MQTCDSEIVEINESPSKETACHLFLDNAALAGTL